MIMKDAARLDERANGNMIERKVMTGAIKWRMEERIKGK